MNQVKKQPRKFSVINCTDTNRTMKFVIPMNMYSNGYIQENVIRTSYNGDYENVVYDYESYSYQGYGVNRLSNFFKLCKIQSGRLVFPQAWSRIGGDYNGSQYRLRLNDGEIHITSSFFDFLKNSFGLKYYEDDTRRMSGNKVKVMIIDDSMISDDLTESMCQVGKMVKVDNADEIWGTETLLGYHYSAWHPKVASNFTKYMDNQIGAVNFGFEAEKQDEYYRELHNAVKLAFETGFKKERDGSLGEGGFELISPVLPLFNDSIINNAIDSVKDILKASTTEKCGGHFNVSKVGVSSREILKKVKGSLPIFYSIYENRLTNSYCKAEKFATYLRSPRKYQSFYLKNDSILEFRIFPAIKSEKILRNRIELMRIVFNDLYGKTHNGVILEMAKKNTKLHKFMLNVVCGGDMDKFKEKIKKFIVMAVRYNIGKVTTHTIKKVEKLMDMVILEPQQVQVSNEPTETEPISITSTEPQTYWYTNEFNRYVSTNNPSLVINGNCDVVIVSTAGSGLTNYVVSYDTTISSDNEVTGESTENINEDSTLDSAVNAAYNNSAHPVLDVRYPISNIRLSFAEMLSDGNVTINSCQPTRERYNSHVPSVVNREMLNTFINTSVPNDISTQTSFTYNVERFLHVNNMVLEGSIHSSTYSSTEDAHNAIDSVVFEEGDIDMAVYSPNTMNKFLQVMMFLVISSSISSTNLFRKDFVFRLSNSVLTENYVSYRVTDDGVHSCSFGRRWDGVRFQFIYNEFSGTLNILTA